MKKLLFLSAFLFQVALLAAQVYVEGVKLEPSNTGQYLEIDPLYREDGSCAFQVDYGQSNPKQNFITEADGKRIHFRSLVDGLNFCYEEGWEVTQISVLEHGRRILLKRRF